MAKGSGYVIWSLLIVLFSSCSVLKSRPGISNPDAAALSSIHFFQDVISPVDGDRCMMLPSCSAYTETAIKKHGFLMGWIMGCDRLMRCGHDELYRSEVLIAGGQSYSVDPVENNDFWWGKGQP